jgi:hypothetical protein
MFENLAQFIATAPVEIQAAFELNERVYAATLEGVLKEKRRNVELQKQLDALKAEKWSSLDNIAIDQIAESMPGGTDGFLKDWGWRQFARAIEEAHGIGVEQNTNEEL